MPAAQAGVGDCIRVTVRHEGLGALSKGLTASLAGIVPFCALDLVSRHIHCPLPPLPNRPPKVRAATHGASTVLLLTTVYCPTGALRDAQRASQPLHGRRAQLARPSLLRRQLERRCAGAAAYAASSAAAL